jgi:hypothetical protein
MTDGITIQVFSGVDAPVVVKTATTDAGRRALAREAERLERARHPGVVSLRSATDTRLEVTFAGSHTLETARLAVPVAAGILAAVAETVADLHGLGIIHGRLDPSHVVLGADGRPVLCGMRGPDPDDVRTGPADDVAAIGRLIDHLLGPDAEPEPIPDRRWGRRSWSGYHRRSLQMLADRAAHEDPARRPTARAVAHAIVEAVPAACVLPPVGADEPEIPSPVAEPRPAATAWEALTEPPTADPRPPDPSPAQPDDLTAVASHRPDAEPTDSTVDHHEEVQELTTDLGDALAAGARSSGDPDTAHDADNGTLDGSSGGEPLRVGPFLRHEEARSDQPARVLGLRVEEPSPDRADRSDVPGPSGASGSVRTPHGSAPPAPAVPVHRRHRRPPSWVLGAAAVGLVVVGLTHGNLGTAPSPARPPEAASPVPAGGPLSTGDPSHPVETLPAGATPGTDPARVEGPVPPALPSGGDETVPRLVHHGITYEVGEPGDQVAVADWDCDGEPTPGLLRPTTGEVFLFPSWAADDQPLSVRAAAVVEGATALREPPAPASGDARPSGEACRVVIERRDQSPIALVPHPHGWRTAGDS